MQRRDALSKIGLGGLAAGLVSIVGAGRSEAEPEERSGIVTVPDEMPGTPGDVIAPLAAPDRDENSCKNEKNRMSCSHKKPP